jgi:hypothetical protein
MSSNVKDFVDLAVDYSAEHMGKSMVSSYFSEAARLALKRRYSMASSRRGCANRIFDRTKCVGDGNEALNTDQIKLGMVDTADKGIISSRCF